MNKETLSPSISLSSKVTLHFSIILDDESQAELDSTFNGKPGTFIMGDGSLLPGFERYLLGMKVGETQEFKVPAKEGFGERQQENIQRMKRSEFDSGIELEKGLVLSFAQQDKKELPGMVADFDEDEVHIDFNHPLSGRDLLFKVEIIGIETNQPREEH
ncbi:MAG: FKBP-type peptidyl-prolyl cis-trans isomerase [Pseudomonadales bacterium]|nr:FKBP-type peptidyl-prolyl cis-trans isomerase [Pseudomonadales bacterium]